MKKLKNTSSAQLCSFLLFSMKLRKMQQTVNAMKTILGEMRDNDFMTIIDFDSTVQVKFFLYNFVSFDSTVLVNFLNHFYSFDSTALLTFYIFYSLSRSIIFKIFPVLTAVSRSIFLLILIVLAALCWLIFCFDSFDSTVLVNFLSFL